MGNCQSLGTCTLLDVPSAGLPCGVDPNDGSNLAFYYAYEQNSVLDQYTYTAFTPVVTFTGTDTQLTTVTASATASPGDATATLTFDYSVPNTAISPGSYVTVNVELDGEDATSSVVVPLSSSATATGSVSTSIETVYQTTTTPLSFQYSPVTSLFFVDATSKMTTTLTESTTTTQTATATATSTIPLITSKSACTTGIREVTAITKTTTTSIITPTAITKHETSWTKTTTTLSCYPQTTDASQKLRRGEMEVAKRIASASPASVQYEQPYCPAIEGPAKATTYTTDTVISGTTTATSTQTYIALETLTTTTVLTPSPATTTVCKDVKGKTTTTVTHTKTEFSVEKRSTTTLEIFSTKTKTQIPKGLSPCTITSV